MNLDLPSFFGHISGILGGNRSLNPGAIVATGGVGLIIGVSNNYGEQRTGHNR